jgi:hypothetical protein
MNRSKIFKLSKCPAEIELGENGKIKKREIQSRAGLQTNDERTNIYIEATERNQGDEDVTGWVWVGLTY